MISGIAGYLKAVKPKVEIIACQPAQSPEMAVSIEQGYIVSELISKPTLSDGTAGGIEQGAITFDYCKQWVDRFELLSEEEIANALLWFLKNRQMMVEGAAGLALATLLREKEQWAGKNVVLIVCGRRLSFEKLKKIVI